MKNLGIKLSFLALLAVVFSGCYPDYKPLTKDEILSKIVIDRISSVNNSSFEVAWQLVTTADDYSYLTLRSKPYVTEILHPLERNETVYYVEFLAEMKGADIIPFFLLLNGSEYQRFHKKNLRGGDRILFQLEKNKPSNRIVWFMKEGDPIISSGR